MMDQHEDFKIIKAWAIEFPIEAAMRIQKLEHKQKVMQGDINIYKQRIKELEEESNQLEEKKALYMDLDD
jgi:DNA repair exonuclease SbcCD ATPase subunit